MKLFDLLEDLGDLEPGEKRVINNVTVRDIAKIENKLAELQQILYHSESLKDYTSKDAALAKTLTDLIIKMSKKRDLLRKVQQRPTTSQMNILKTVAMECSDFVKALKETERFLFRGTRNDESVFEGRSRDDRRTKDSDSTISDAFDEIMAYHGSKALRQNSIFTTTNRARASGYGYNVYLIFPKNGFNFLNTTSEDLILDSWYQLSDHDAINDFFHKLKAWIQENNVDLSGTQMGWYMDVGRAAAVMSELEHNFNVYETRFKIPQEFNVSMKDFVSSQAVIERFEPNTTDLVAAMNSTCEILINGEYWALKRSDWEKLAASYFLNITD